MVQSPVIVLSLFEIIDNILADRPISLDELTRLSNEYPNIRSDDIHESQSSSVVSVTRRNIYITGPSRDLLRKSGR